MIRMLGLKSVGYRFEAGGLCRPLMPKKRRETEFPMGVASVGGKGESL